MIQFATCHQKKALVALYNRSFPHDENFCRWFFDTLWQPENTLVDIQNETVTAMLHMLPLQMESSAQNLNCVYFFALATDAKMRGKGIMSTLIHHAFALCRQKNIAAVTLLVQNENLFDFYAKQGFQKSFFVSKNTCKAQTPAPHFSVRPMTSADYDAVNVLYRSAVQNTLHGVRDKVFFENLLAAYHDTCYVLTDNVGCMQAYCIGGSVQDSRFFATECIGPQCGMLMAALAQTHALPSAVWQSTSGDAALGCMLSLNSESIPFENTFLNLMYN